MIPANGSATLSLTLLAPSVSYFDATHSYPHLNFTGWLQVSVEIVPN
ncbi:MAG TPA: hypothetical protein VGX00_08370 [Thermoplasmata archaeon]|nr:hypothetical protein [Thermoplasmata archaeon]